MNKGTTKTSILLSIICVAFVAAFPALFLFFQNADEARFEDILLVMLGFIAAGLIIFTISMLLIKKPAKAGLVSCLFLLIFMNYSAIENIIQKIFSSLCYWHIVPLFVVLFLHIAWIICRFMPDDICGILIPIIATVIIGLIVINAIPAISVINARIKVEQTTEKYTNKEICSERKMPNIYYLLFDEYSSCKSIKKHYNYDNSVFVGWLKSQGFSISNTSHNDSISTTTVTTNLMNLEYIVDDTWSDYDKTQIRQNARLFSMLSQYGYTLYSLSDFYGLPMIGQTQKKSLAVTISGETISDVLISNSVLYPLFSKYTNDIQEQEDYVIQFIQTAEKNRFLIAHFELPHQPFRYDRDGNMLASANNNWKEKHYYLDQYIYATKVMEHIVGCILQYDPNSVIFLQSDHSARAALDSELFNVMFTMEDMTNIFNCVYYYGEILDIEGLSGVNTARLVFGKLLDVNLPMIDKNISQTNGFSDGERSE